MAISQEKLINQLLQNNISLQKKNTELIESINTLSKKINSMLTLFEDAAKQIKSGEVEQPLGQKLEELLEQNRKIARGLLLLERYIREKTFSSPTFPAKEFPKTEF